MLDPTQYSVPQFEEALGAGEWTHDELDGMLEAEGNRSRGPRVGIARAVKAYREEHLSEPAAPEPATVEDIAEPVGRQTRGSQASVVQPPPAPRGLPPLELPEEVEAPQKGDRVFVTLEDGQRHEAYYRGSATGIFAMLRDGHDTVAFVQDGKWERVPEEE